MLLFASDLADQGEERTCSASSVAATGCAAGALMAGAGVGELAVGAAGAVVPPRTANDGNDGVDLRCLTRGNFDFGEDAGGGRGNLGVDLVGRDLKERLVALDGVADVLQPLRDGAFEDGLAHLRHEDVLPGTGSRCGFRFGDGDRCGLRLWRLGCGCGRCRGGAGSGRCPVANDADHGVHLHGRAFLGADLGEHAGGGRRNLRVDFVR